MADVNLSIVDRDGATRQVTAASGAVLMEVLRDTVDLTIGTCGGVISCGTCLVRLCPEWLAILPAPGGDEAEMLDALEAGPGARLSCQLVLDDAAQGMVATIAPAE